jgi:hypothetical protein
MQHDGSLRIGDTVSLTLRRGLFGILHTESVHRQALEPPSTL